MLQHEEVFVVHHLANEYLLLDPVEYVFLELHQEILLGATEAV